MYRNISDRQTDKQAYRQRIILFYNVKYAPNNGSTSGLVNYEIHRNSGNAAQLSHSHVFMTSSTFFKTPSIRLHVIRGVLLLSPSDPVTSSTRHTINNITFAADIMVGLGRQRYVQKHRLNAVVRCRDGGLLGGYWYTCRA